MAYLKNPRFVVITFLVIAAFAFWLFVPKFIIGSGSMHPTLPVGTIVIMTDPGNLEPRDIITYQKEGDDQPTTHTFIGYTKDGFLLTRGDANPSPDLHYPSLKYEDVIGKVWRAIPPTRLIGFALILGVVVVIIPTSLKKEEETQQSTSPA